MDDDPVTRLRNNITEITVMVLTGLWLVGLFAGQWWWLPLLLVSYIVIIPLVALLFGDESDRAEWWDWGEESWSEQEESERDESAERTGSEPARSNNADALETLRDRYAAGELTDEQFERKLERLLETETLEDAEQWRRDAEADRMRNRDRDIEYET